MHPTTIQAVGAALFAIAILHTFSTRYFEHLAHSRPAHAGLWHLLGEVEVVFGFWAMMLVIAIVAIDGVAMATDYIDSRNFTEPMFVFAIMVISATRPVLQTVTSVIRQVAEMLPFPGSIGMYLVVLLMVPLTGSLITEPAAMTLAALILSRQFFARGISTRLKYTTLGVLFVNVSIGGTLTSFAAPPIVMVADAWGWDVSHMLGTFGWKAVIAVAINAVGAAVVFRRELGSLVAIPPDAGESRAPLPLVGAHLFFLVSVVVFAHHPAIFMGLFLFFLGVANAYEQYQDRILLREGMLVAFFLAGLVVIGGQQQWWLQPFLTRLSDDAVFVGAIALTAVTDNAALTYLGSLVEGLTESFKYALVAGAVTGGGLTIIANAPNPAGLAVLRHHFEDGEVSAVGLLVAAAVPTLVAAAAFWLL